MAVSKKDIENSAHLARLILSEADIEKYTQQLSNILRLIDELNQVDTQDIEPMAHPIDVAQRLRDDKVTETNQREIYQKKWPYAEAGLYLVNKVVE